MSAVAPTTPEEREEARRLRALERQREQIRRRLQRALDELDAAWTIVRDCEETLPSRRPLQYDVERQIAHALDTLHYVRRTLEQEG